MNIRSAARKKCLRTATTYQNTVLKITVFLFDYTYFSWPDCVRNEELLQRIKVERHDLQTVQRGKVNQIGHTFLRNCLLKHATEGKIERRIEVKGRRGRISKKLQDKQPFKAYRSREAPTV